MSAADYGTSGGVELTDELIERLAARAEEGYDASEVRPRGRRGRPAMGSAAAAVFQVRLEPELYEALVDAAALATVSPSELTRRALREYLLENRETSTRAGDGREEKKDRSLASDRDATDELERFAGDLRQLQRDRGVTVRQLSTAIGRSRSTVYEAMSGRRRPTWEVVHGLLVAFGEDPTDWRSRWEGLPQGRSETVDLVSAGAARVVSANIPGVPRLTPMMKRVLDAFWASVDAPSSQRSGLGDGPVSTAKGEYVDPYLRLATDSGSSGLRKRALEYLVSYLATPRATGALLVILGSPGSGKSLLTQVLAAKLAGDGFLPARVALDRVPAGIGVRRQIEYGIKAATGEDLSWPDLVRHVRSRQSVVIIDGLDELVVNGGSGAPAYLEGLREFQQRERAANRPVAVIVTGRFANAARFGIPPDAVVGRLASDDDPPVDGVERSKVRSDDYRYHQDAHPLETTHAWPPRRNIMVDRDLHRVDRPSDIDIIESWQNGSVYTGPVFGRAPRRHEFAHEAFPRYFITHRTAAFCGAPRGRADRTDKWLHNPHSDGPVRLDRIPFDTRYTVQIDDATARELSHAALLSSHRSIVDTLASLISATHDLDGELRRWAAGTLLAAHPLTAPIVVSTADLDDCVILPARLRRTLRAPLASSIQTGSACSERLIRAAWVASRPDRKAQFLADSEERAMRLWSSFDRATGVRRGDLSAISGNGLLVEYTGGVPCGCFGFPVALRLPVTPHSHGYGALPGTENFRIYCPRRVNLSTNPDVPWAWITGLIRSLRPERVRYALQLHSRRGDFKLASAERSPCVGTLPFVAFPPHLCAGSL